MTKRTNNGNSSAGSQQKPHIIPPVDTTGVLTNSVDKPRPNANRVRLNESGKRK